MSKYIDGIELVTIQCCNCDMVFAMTADFRSRRQRDHAYFYCPAGHSQHFVGKTKEQELREQLEREQERREAAQREAGNLRHQNKKISRSYGKMRERVRNGVCPCCNRTFQDLLNHIRSQHPDFGNEKQLRTVREIYGLTQADLADELGIPAGYVSMYENGRDGIPEYAKGMLDTWFCRSQLNQSLMNRAYCCATDEEET